MMEHGLYLLKIARALICLACVLTTGLSKRLAHMEPTQVELTRIMAIHTVLIMDHLVQEALELGLLLESFLEKLYL
jgi:hypothetical protein